MIIGFKYVSCALAYREYLILHNEMKNALLMAKEGQTHTKIHIPIVKNSKHYASVIPQC